MSTTVKSLKVTHNPVNDSDTFSSGDEVTGQVTLEVVKECHIDSLSIKFKGKSEVLWTERHGKTTVVYHSKDKYFSNNSYLIQDDNGDSRVVAPGCHVYPFTFKFPEGDFPNSFTGSAGKITYSLEARLSRSMRIPQKDKEKLKFMGRVDLSGERGLLEPQHDCKDKKLKIFSSGTVSMDVRLDKTGYFQGEGIEVKAHIQNDSSRPIKPKYCLYTKHNFFASGRRRLCTHDLLKEVGEPILPSSQQNVTRIITIPLEVEPSIHNCTNIKIEHKLRVYLDVKYASDPEIKFPVVILPISGRSALAPPPSKSDFGNQTFWNPEPPAGAVAPSGPPAWAVAPPGPPAWAVAPPGPPAWAVAPSEPPAWGAAPTQLPADTQASDPPPPYGAYAIYPPPRH